MSDDELRRRWKTVLGMVEVQIGNEADFDAYLAKSAVSGFSDGVLRVVVQNGFIAVWISQRVMGALRRCAAEVFGREVTIELDTMPYRSGAELARDGLAGDVGEWARTHERRHRESQALESARMFPTNRRQTFERFEVSDCNRGACNAALQVVADPGVEFNPLTLTGDAGQGKTHLLNAIANAARKTRRNVVILTGEEFVDAFVKASRKGNVDILRERLRGAEILLVDGVERLIGKAKTQAFFLHVVEHLMSQQRQVVMSFNSAYPMGELGVEIGSRLAAGLEMRLDAPDEALMRQVLGRFAEERNLRIDDAAFAYLREVVVGNVREIIGGITRADAERRFTAGSAGVAESASPVGYAEIREALTDRLSVPDPSLPSPDEVLRAVAGEFGLDVAQLRRPGRGNRALSTARDVAIYLLRERCGMTSTETGKLMGGRPHSTILASLKRYEARREVDTGLAGLEGRVLRAV